MVHTKWTSSFILLCLLLNLKMIWYPNKTVSFLLCHFSFQILPRAPLYSFKSLSSFSIKCYYMIIWIHIYISKCKLIGLYLVIHVYVLRGCVYLDLWLFLYFYCCLLVFFSFFFEREREGETEGDREVGRRETERTWRPLSFFGRKEGRSWQRGKCMILSRYACHIQLHFPVKRKSQFWLEIM